ncbi:50S ribosomal protein L31, partial [Helicobacter pylori]
MVHATSVEFRNASPCYHNFFNKVKFYFNF